MSEHIGTRAELSCEQCRELLSEFVDQELKDADREAVQHHLVHCPKCSRESVELQGLKRLVQHWDGVPGNEQFRDSAVQQFIRESQMLQSGKFTEAAERARAEAEVDAPRGLPAALVLSLAAVLAVIAYFLVKSLSN